MTNYKKLPTSKHSNFFFFKAPLKKVKNVAISLNSRVYKDRSFFTSVGIFFELFSISNM